MASRTVTRILSAALLACLLWPPAAARARTVGAMRVEPASPPVQEVLDRCAVTHPGDPLDVAALERTAALLRVSGLFASVGYAIGDGEPADVAWTLAPRASVSSIGISGNLLLLSSTLRQDLPVRRGEPYREDLPAKVREAILAVYRANGFPDAAVDVTAVAEPPFGYALDVRIREEKPRVIRAFRFAGGAPFADDELSRIAGIVLGTFWSEKAGETMRASVLEFLRGQGYLEAACTVSTEPHEGTAIPPLDLTRPFMTVAGLWPGTYPGVRVVVEIALGLRWRMVLSGIPQGLEPKVVGALTFAPSGTVDAYERERSRREVRRALQGEGYFGATAEIAFSWLPSPSITVTAIPGPPASGYDIAYAGIPVETLPSLREALATVAADFPNLTDDLLGRLQESTRAILLASGYPYATVHEPAAAWRQDGARWLVTVSASPGMRLLAGPLAVEGISLLTGDEAAAVMEWTPGLPFDASRAAAGRERLASLLRSRGHLAATVDLAIDEVEGTVSGRCVVREGPRFVNGAFAVVGTDVTSVPFVLRTAGLVPGSPSSPAAIAGAQLSLYKTGLFARAQVEPSRPDGPASTVDYLVRVEETPPRRLNVAAGYGDRDGWRGQVSLRHVSLFGSGEEGYVSAKISQKSQEYGLGLRLPYLPAGWTAELGGYRQRREHPSFDEEATGGRISVGKALADAWRLSVGCRVERYEYPGFAEGFAPVAGSAEPGSMAGFPVTLRYDDRDNPFLPTAGALYEATVEYAPDLFGDGGSFTRIEGSAAAFLTPWRSLTVGLSLRAGTIVPAGSGEVPLRERYFLGGGTSVRGFVPDGLGPKDPQGNPVGGRTMVAASLELRFPLSAKLQGACFADAGGVFLDNGISWNGIDSSVGIGARYLTPIGPVRLDLAWRLDARSGEDPFRIHFTLGYPF